MSRYLGVDLGTVRIGLALSEPGGIVSPLAVLPARPTPEENAREILKSAADYDVDGIVIGLPLNMDDTEGPQAKLSRTLAKAIEKATASGGTGASSGGTRKKLEIHLHDERLTSFDADQRLIGRDLTRKKKKARQDALAAQILLQSFLDSRPPQTL
jgi:putative holliday junction resolvase